MKSVLVVTVLALGTFVAAGANAQQGYRYGHGGGATFTPGIDAAQARQMQRIEQGRRSGQLTAAEYHRLVAEQHRIAQLERRAKADGVATRAERYQIRQAQRQASRHIFNEKHDRQARGHFMARRWW